MRALLAACVLVLAACGEAPGADPDAEFQRELAAAKDKARASITIFWDSFAEPGADDYDFRLKAALPRRDGQTGVEEAWVENIARAPDKIVGELADQPRYLGDLAEGAIVEFQPEQIVDWGFLRGEKLLGNYTTRVMLPRMDTVQADWLRALLSNTPEGGVAQ